ncbi:MAG: hypothetical protein EVA78_06065 [Phycisphaeraceae bacterium]|nr:MAG: hypothetical protein EVA78_06065 [Phycisphaeraceae bacterium]
MKFNNALIGIPFFCTYALLSCFVLDPSFAYGQAEARGTGNFGSWDINKDGVLTREEVPPGPRRMFDRIDTNGDGKVTFDEHRAGGRQPEGSPRRANSKNTNVRRFTIRQSWSQQPNGFGREYVVRSPKNDLQSWPITILFHGNGGSAEPMIRNWDRTLPNHILVSAQGYEKSWNITKERSKAPDVEFVEMILRDVTSHYPQADDSKVSLIGSSNGAGMVYRLLIELDDTYSIQNALAFVSSMTVSQYHDEQFWKRTDETTSNYDQPVEPSGKRRIITIHGSADSVVPYYGGRGPGGIHLSAQDTAYVWATVQGYRGDQRPDNEGKPCGEKLLMYDYPQSGVTHIKVIDGGHGLGPAAAPLKPLLMKMLGWSGDS